MASLVRCERGAILSVAVLTPKAARERHAPRHQTVIVPLAYLLHRKAEPADEFVSMLCRQNGNALKLLKTWEVSPEQRLHRARQAFKRCRAALRLLKQASPYVYAVENSFYRDQAHALAYARDASAMVEALDKLAQRDIGAADRQSLEMLRDSLVLQAELDTRTGLAGVVGQVARVCRQLEAADTRLRNLPVAGLRRRTLVRGARRTLTRCARGFSALGVDSTADEFHEWRKHVKYAYYQCSLMAEYLPRKLRRSRPALGALAEMLGDFQDLTLIAKFLDKQPDSLGVDSHVQRLQRLIGVERSRLRLRFMQAGADLFGAGPADLTDGYAADVVELRLKRGGASA